MKQQSTVHLYLISPGSITSLKNGVFSEERREIPEQDRFLPAPMFARYRGSVIVVRRGVDNLCKPHICAIGAERSPPPVMRSKRRKRRREMRRKAVGWGRRFSPELLTRWLLPWSQSHHWSFHLQSFSFSIPFIFVQHFSSHLTLFPMPSFLLSLLTLLFLFLLSVFSTYKLAQ